MLEEIRITHLGVIEESVLEVGPGLTVITGETGAGKTMVVTALGLLLGGRADAGAVRAGAQAARVEGVLTLDAAADGPLVSEVEEVGGVMEDGRLLVARQISAQGRSRAYVGGAAVPVGTLAGLIAPRVAVHGQSDQHRLLQPEAQRHALDAFAGEQVSTLRAAYAEAYSAHRERARELAETLATLRERAREADVLRFGLEEIAAVEPVPGEDRQLASEEARLGNADTLRGAAETARQALSSDGDRPDVLGLTATARQQLDSVREHDPAAGELADRLAEVSYLLSDLAADVASYATGVDVEPARLAAVSERRAALTALQRKYGETVDEVLAWAEQGSRRLLELDGTEDRVAELREEVAALRARLADLAGRLSAARAAAARRLADAVTTELAQLAMRHAVVEVQVRQQESADGLEVDGRQVAFGPAGVDDVDILLAANRGSDPRPLGRGASGGELSRVMLGIEVALADTRPVPTFVFDEVDAGVGGRAAVEIGRRLARLAGGSQVLVVTHLPQVAAYADRHVVVEKSHDGTVTTSGLVTLEDGARVRELSRMLAGLEDSATALAHAEELLATARTERP